MPRRNLANGKLRNGRNRAFSRTYLRSRLFISNSTLIREFMLAGVQARLARIPSSVRDRALTDRFHRPLLVCR